MTRPIFLFCNHMEKVSLSVAGVQTRWLSLSICYQLSLESRMPLSALMAKLHSLLRVVLGLGVHQGHHVLTCKGAFQPAGLQPGLVSGITSPQVQDLAFPSVGISWHPVSASLQPVEGSLDSDMTLWPSSHSSQLCYLQTCWGCVMPSTKAEMKIWKRTQYRDTLAIHSCPRGLHAIDNLLGPSSVSF